MKNFALKTTFTFVAFAFLFGCIKSNPSKTIGTDNDITLPYLERVTSHVYKSFSKDKSYIYALLLNIDLSFQLNTIDNKNRVINVTQGQWSKLNETAILLDGHSETGTPFKHEAEIVDNGAYINITISKDSILELEALGF